MSVFVSSVGMPPNKRFRSHAISAGFLLLLILVVTPWSPAAAWSRTCEAEWEELLGDENPIAMQWLLWFEQCNPEGIVVVVPDASATEGTDATIDFEVSLSKPQTARKVVVDWSIEPVTAEAGEDYTDARGTLTFAPGESTKTISIAVLDDSVSEDVETFSLKLTNARGANLFSHGLPQRSQIARGTIFTDEDIDPPSVAVTASYSIDPPVSGWFNWLTCCSASLSRAWKSRKLEVTNGAAVRIWSSHYNRGDYIVTIVPDADATGNLSVAVPAGAATDSFGNANTASEPFNIAVEPLGDQTIGTTGATLSCWDVEAHPDGLGGDYRGGGEVLPNSVWFNIEFERPVLGFNWGQVAVTKDGIDVERKDDLFVTGSDREYGAPYWTAIARDVSGTIVVELLPGRMRDSHGRFVYGSNRLHFAGHHWSASVSDVSAETGSDATIDFEVALNARDDCRTVTVDWEVLDGTATAGEDYTAASGTLTFQPGETKKSIGIALLDGAVAEEGETLTLRLSNISTQALDIGLANAEATGTITRDSQQDTDAPAVTVTSEATSPVSGEFEIDVTFSEPVSGFEMSELEVTNGTAVRMSSLEDGTVHTVTIAPGSDATGQVTVTVPEGVATDTAGNANTASAAFSIALPERFTARFEGLPETHDGRNAFSFELHFSEDIEGLSFRTVRDALLDVSGAEVTKAKRLTSGSNQSWRLTVRPSSGGDIAVALPARACGETGAVCTTDGRSLSEGISETVDGVPFSASFARVPAEHDGTKPFTLHLRFNHEPAVSFRTVRDHLLEVTSGTVKKAKRLTQGSNRGWALTIKPESLADVVITVRGTDSCDAAHAVCTAGGNKLPGGASVTVHGPASLSVADAEVREGRDAKLNFVVTLSRERNRATRVAYATSDGTATAGADYTAVNGTLTFRAGETSKSVWVEVLDDAHDEGSETLTLTLSNARGAGIADATATGTIVNNDPMPQAWITRFGRTVGSQVVDAVTSRFEGASGSHVTVGGMRFDDAGLAGADPVDRSEWAMESEQRTRTRTMTKRELLLGSSFHLSSGERTGGGAAFTAWGRVATGGFEADVDDVRMDGDVTTGLVGVDAEWDRVLAGVMLSQSTGDGSYTLSEALGDDRGTVESTMTGVYPYARLAMSERMSAWGLAGVGSGELTLRQEGQAPIDTDLWHDDGRARGEGHGARRLGSERRRPPCEV